MAKRKALKESDLVRMLKEMYTITEDGKIKRVMDCSMRDWTSHENTGETMCQMKIKHMKTRDIAFCLWNDKLPHKGVERVVYKDGNRRNHKKENLVLVNNDDYFKAVNIGLMILAENKKMDKFIIKSPKDFKDVLAKRGLESFGMEAVLRIIKNSALGRVQESRMRNMVRRLKGVVS
jgi:hypothetical protein